MDAAITSVEAKRSIFWDSQVASQKTDQAGITGALGVNVVERWVLELRAKKRGAS